MQKLSEKEKSEWTIKKTIVRVIAYLFCGFFIWFGFDALTSSPTTLKDKLRAIGEIVAACVYLSS